MCANTVHVFYPLLDKINGVTKLTIDLALAIADIGFDVCLYSRGIHKDFLMKIKRNKRINVEHIDIDILLKGLSTPKQLIYNYKSVKKIRKNIDKNDIVILTDGFYLARFFKTNACAKVILYHYFPYSLSYRFWRTDFTKLEQGQINILSKILSKLESFYYKKYVDLIIVYSKFVSNIFQKYLNIETIVIPPPIDTSFYVPMKKKYNMILTVTRFHPDKELDTMIKWFTKYVKDNDVYFYVAGRVLEKYLDYYNLLASLAKEDKRVIIVKSPSENELRKLYGEAFIFWYIHQEHCATTPVEAMSAGAIPIIMDKPGLREAIIHNHTGFIAKNKNEFIKFTNMILKNPNDYEYISINARKHALENFSHKSFANKIYNALITKNIIRS